MHVLPYILLIVATWLAMAVVYSGIGLLFRRAFVAQPAAARELILAPWIGWCLALALLQVWHLFLPVDWKPLLLIALAGLIGIVCHARPLAALTCRMLRQRPGMLIVLLLSAFWLANHTAIQHTIYDSGFYHLSAISWIESYRVVPGLGNLSKMLGFNDSYFLYVALMDIGPFKHKVHHVAGSFLIFLLLCRMITGWWSVWRGGKNVRLHHVMDALILVYIAVLAMGAYGSSHSPDLPVYAIGFVVGSELLRLMETRARRGSPVDQDASDPAVAFYSLVLIAGIGIAVKLSLAVFALTACVLAVVTLVRSGEIGAVLRPRHLGIMIAIGLLILIPWAIRGIVLTGSIGYPATLAVFPVDWRVPPETAQEYAKEIRAWARQPRVDPDTVMSGRAWLWPWFNEMTRAPFEVVVPLALACIALPGVLCLRCCGAALPENARAARLFLVLPVVALVFWFFAAPDPRFAGAAFWLLGAGALAIALSRLDRVAIVSVLAVFTILAATMNFNPIAFLHRWKRDMGPERTGATKAITTRSGLIVRVPVEGRQVWRAPLPATPYLNPDLRLREPGDLSSGFTVMAGDE